MGKVTAIAERTIAASAGRVHAIVSDYVEGRPKILTEHYRDYQVVEGGTGAGTTVTWKLQATSKRVRNVVATVTESVPGTLVETDANSSMVTTWTTREAEGGSAGVNSIVRIETSWNGAGGIAGFFERIFAPKGLTSIYNSVLQNLATLAEGPA